MLQTLESQAPTATQALVGWVLVLASLAVAPLAVALARKLVPGRNVFFARWRFAHVAWVVLAYLALGAAAGLLQRALAGDGEPGALALIGWTVVAQAGVGVLVWRFAQALDPAGWRSLGLWRGGHARASLVGALGYLVALPGILGLGLVGSWLLDRFGIAHEPQAIAELALELDPSERWIFVVAAALVVPLFEELAFRAFIQPLLVQNLGDRGGVAVTSVVFAALHGTTAFLPILGLSLLLGMLMLRTQRLSAVWLVHALHNGLMLALLFLVPDARELLGQ